MLEAVVLDKVVAAAASVVTLTTEVVLALWFSRGRWLDLIPREEAPLAG